MVDYAAQRHNMVESQIRPNEVTDEALIEALAAIPREAFVPKELIGIAYVDEALSLGGGRYLMEPLVAARLIQAAEPRPTDLALVVGCGTGYEAAVLARLVGTVVAIENNAELAQRAAATLGEQGIDTVAVIEGALGDGCPDQAPFDVVFVNGAVADVPDAITRQLADHGRLVAVVDDDGVGRAALVTRHRDGFYRRPVFDAGTPPLPGFEREKTFVF